MTLLDDLSGYEFEDAIASLFRALDYEAVSVADRVADEGRDITMRNGDTAVVVECKHTDTVSRPVVQKLHSAVATYDAVGPKRGMVVTSGRFTGPAEEYAERLRANGDPHPIELVDGADLRRLGEQVGMDLYNGRIEIVCEETLPVGDPERVLVDAFEPVENAPTRAALPAPDVDVRYRPIVDAEAVTRATFETSVGVIHRIDRRDHLVVDADREGPSLAPGGAATLVGVEPMPIDEARSNHGGDVSRFGATESEYREWVKRRLCDRLERTVSYTGGNNVTYERECRPAPSDVRLGTVRSLYLPRVTAGVELGEYSHGYAYDAAGDRQLVREDRIRRCVHCDTSGADAASYTYCGNCGSINCETHTREERLTGDPICTGCAVIEQFFFAEKYFFDETNAERFRERYEAMPFYRKPLENPRLLAVVVGIVALAILLAVAAL